MTSSLQLKRLLAGVAIASCLLTATTAARANITIQFDPSGLPTPGGSINALDLTGDVGQTSFLTNNSTVDVEVNTASEEGVVQGSMPGLYAAPVSGGSEASPTTWTQPYFSTGLGTITLTFSHAQSYLGVLWGSVDIGNGTTNSITFNNVHNGTVTQVGVVTGNEIHAAAESGAASGSQGYDGSFYTVLDDLGGTFNQIVLSSTVISFEAADIEYASTAVDVPEAGTIALLGTGLLALAALRHRRQA